MKFENSLIVSVKKARHKRLFVLQEPLACIDDQGRKWIVPKGFATDFASIPAFGRAFIDKAHQNAYAAVLHDFLYYTQPVSRPEADLLFKEALASPDCNTTPLKQWVMYRAVRVGGLKAWLKVKKELKTTPAMEIKNMADDTLIKEEKSLFGKFLDWVKKTRTKVDEELEELDDEVRPRVNRLFRQANWPGVRDREILFRNKAQKSIAFKIAYALVFLSSCITLYYWWGAMPDLTSKLLIGLGFFAANLLMPIWARMTFWQGGTWLQPVVNFAGLIILLGVSGASIVASAGLQGTKSDEVRSERAQQKLQYETQLAEATALKQRIAQLRRSTTRAPNEIQSELDGLLVSEPSPQSGCRSRDNFGAWSKRNCTRVARLRTEISQAKELKQLEAKADSLSFSNTPRVTTIDPQYEIAKRYMKVDQKTFNETKPLILAIMLELIFNGLTILLTITMGAEVREELRDRVARQRRDLINQAENEVLAGRKPDEPEPVLEIPEPEPKPLSPAPLAATPAIAQSPKTDVPEGFAVLPKTKRETVTETTREVTSATLTNVGTKSFLEATEPQPTQIIQEPALQIPVIEDVVEEAEIVPQNTITQVQDPTVVAEVEELKAKLAAQEKAQEVVDTDQADLKAENLSLRFANLSTNRATPAEVQQLAKYAVARFAYRVGQNIDLNFALKDYEAWCTKNGLTFDKPVQEFRSLLENDLGLTVADTGNGAVILLDTELKT
jgi:hypothetical protein